MTFVADVYMGCPHNCVYCYGPSTRRATPSKAKSDFMQSKLRLTNRDLAKIDKQIEGFEEFGPFEYLSSKGNEDTRIREALKRKFPVRIGSVSDPFQEKLEKENRHTEKILEWFGRFNYPYLICTKSKLVADSHYLKLIKETNGAVQVSLISLEKELLSRLEPHASSSDERLESMTKLVDEGIWTACRIQPLIPQVTETGMPNLLDNLATIGVNHVTIEFMKFPQAHVNYMNESMQTILRKYYNDDGELPELLVELDFNLKKHYRSYDDSVFRDQYFFFSKSEKNRLMKHYVELVNEANKQYGSKMMFASGDEETTYLNFTQNCCGIDEIWGETGYASCTIQKMLQLAKEKGRVTLSDMSSYYNPYPEDFEKLWSMPEKGKTFFENHVINLVAKKNLELNEIYYEYKED